MMNDKLMQNHQKVPFSAKHSTSAEPFPPPLREEPLPAALLHLDGRNRLRPEAFVGFAAAACPAGQVALSAPPAPLGTRRHSQIQR